MRLMRFWSFGCQRCSVNVIAFGGPIVLCMRIDMGFLVEGSISINSVGSVGPKLESKIIRREISTGEFTNELTTKGEGHHQPV